MASQMNSKRNSPFKKCEPAKQSPKLAKKNHFKIQVWGFEHFPLELYSYNSAPNKDGYLFSYRKHVDNSGDDNVPILAAHGFTSYYKRRVSINRDEIQIADDNYTRFYLGHFVPEMLDSTPETRQEGLRAENKNPRQPNR